MAKQKKNANYNTEKRRASEQQKAEQKRKEKNAKTAKLVAIVVGAVLAFVAVVFGILFAVGVFDYVPETTYDAAFTFSDGSQVHIELFGKDAPETVEHFIELCEDGYFEGMSVRTFANGMLTVGAFSADGGDKGIKGEFKQNGINNQSPAKRGYILLNRGESFDSGYGQFMILTKNKPSLASKYAVFGMVSDMSVIDNMLKKIEVNSDGTIKEATAPRIVSVSVHASHSH